MRKQEKSGTTLLHFLHCRVLYHRQSLGALACKKKEEFSMTRRKQRLGLTAPAMRLKLDTLRHQGANHVMNHYALCWIAVSNKGLQQLIMKHAIRIWIKLCLIFITSFYGFSRSNLTLTHSTTHHPFVNDAKHMYSSHTPFVARVVHVQFLISILTENISLRVTAQSTLVLNSFCSFSVSFMFQFKYTFFV